MTNNIRVNCYGKVFIVLELLDKLKKYGVEVYFDNTRVNNYTLTLNNIPYSFATYDSVISCLNMFIDYLKSEEE